MRVFQDLDIQGPPESLRRFLDDLTARLTGWERDPVREQRLREMSISRDEVFAIRTPPGGDLPAATLYLHGNEGTGTCRVSNIVPGEANELSKPQYNAILRAFYEGYVRDHAARFGLTALLSKDQITSRDVLSEQNARLLGLFSAAANMSTGSSHPLDGRRWRDFLSNSFRAGEILDEETLRGLLLDEGWPEEQAYDLAGEYEAAMDVLRNFTGQESG